MLSGPQELKRLEASRQSVGDETMINLGRPQIGKREIREVSKVMRSRRLAQGEQVQQFETEFSELLAHKRVSVAVNSGTSALHLALIAAGIGPGDEVLVPSFTFAATANVVVLAGATPVFCDVDPRTFNMDASTMKSKITERTRGVIPVHLYGLPSEMRGIQAVARDHGLLIIEDAAQAHLAEIDGQPVGTFGDFAAFSFYPTKNMTSGEGGMAVASSDAPARAIRLLRNQGMEVRYQNEIVGFNNRMSDIHAAIGRVQLQRLRGWTEKRIRNAKYFSENLDGVRTPFVPDGFKHVFHQYTIRIPADRDGFAEALRREHRVETAVYYPIPAHRLPSMKIYSSKAELPGSDRASEEVLSIPVHPALTTREKEKIVFAVNKVSKSGG